MAKSTCFTLSCCALALLWQGAAFAAPAAAPTAQQLPELVQQWLSLTRQQQQLQSQWQQEQPLLEQQLQLLNQEQQQLSATVHSQQGGQSQVSEQREQLAREQQQLEAEQQQLLATLSALRQQLQQLAPRLPPPLQQSWQAQLPALSANSATAIAAATASDDAAAQLQLVLSLLNQWHDFQKRIVVSKSTIELNGEQHLVSQLYLGVSYAWFISDDGRVKGIGHSQGSQWQWQLQPSLDGGAIAQAMAMYHKQQPAALLSLPFPVPGAALATSASPRQ